MKSRFFKEISGELGNFWKKSAEKELDELKEELNKGEITIDENGIARNYIGNVVMDDLAEKISFISNKINLNNTRQARKIEVFRELKNYHPTYTVEDLIEIKNVFGENTKVIDIINGKQIQ